MDGQIASAGAGSTAAGPRYEGGTDRPARRLAGRRLQALVIGVVMLVTVAASTLAASLVVDSNAPFDHAFAAQHGAGLAVVVNPDKPSAEKVAATARLAGVTAAAGPFAEATVTATVAMPGVPGGAQLPALTPGCRSLSRSA